jgi:branched-chain amino acid transport system ATP-binding protein
MIPPALELAHLKKRFGGLPATKDVSLAVMPGERRLIIGPNGAGKTTLFNLITGDLSADAGSVRLFGRELLGMPTQARVHLGLARTYQILTLFPRERLIHNVVLALLGLDRRRWNPWSILTANRDLYDAAHEALQRVGLGDSAQRIVIETSYGERRRLELAIGGLDHRPFAGRAPDRARAARRHPARRHHRHDRARHGHRAGFCRAHHRAALRRGHCRRHAC